MLVALDFDGTLLRTDQSISDATLAALADVVDRGGHVIGATGRPPALADPIASMVPSMSYLISNNGALTVRLADRLTVADVTMPLSDAVSAILRVRELLPGVGIAVDQVGVEAERSQVWEDGFADLVPNAPLGSMVDDVLDHLTNEVRKVLVFRDDLSVPELLSATSGMLGDGLAATHSGLEFIEVAPPGVSKASALEQLRLQLGVAAEDTVAFGDAHNDIEMLNWAHSGVAMANADEETRRHADAITASNDDDGIAAWLRN